MVDASEKKSFKDVDSRVDIDQLERDVLSYWEEGNIFERSLEQRKDAELFTFYDGPPYATGKPHYGHILQSAIKDTVLRYKTMRGYRVPRRVGWDTHGLPVETLVEKELGFKNKKDIEEYGIEEFNAKCREMVMRYVDDFTAVLKRMGRWADYENAYFTLDRDYMESEWWTFKQLWDDELVYKAFRSTPYCIRCATPLSNFEVTINYHDTTDQALYVALPVYSERQSKSEDEDGPSADSTSSLQAGSGPNQKLWLLIWTTTPWTLPGNVAVAISSELTYVTVAHEGKRYVVAKDLVAKLFGDDAEVVQEWQLKDLLKLQYEKVFDFIPVDGPRPVVTADHVSAEEGTGLVHMAPAFGIEDFEVGKKNDLPVVRNVDTSGAYTSEVPPWEGENVFEANHKIIAALEERGWLFKQEAYTHSYPFCWRCDTPLIYYALDTWFVKVSELKEDMLKLNAEQIEWTPKHVKQGRFAKGIESAPDWAVSRNRYWSVPVPVWECEQEDCEERVCVGSLAELQELTGVAEVPDIHRPFVDELTWSCKKCAGTMHRIEEVLDVWFDAGSMPYAQWHYPFENKEFVEEGFPADFIVEAIEQTRLWFYVLHVIATALTRKNIGLGEHKPAFRNAIGSGIIFAEDGKKLSKKLQNYPEIESTLKNFGADVLRFYLLSSSTLGEPYRFSEKDLKKLQQNVYLTLWNVYSFFVRYAKTHHWTPSNDAVSTNILDQWIMARLKELEQQVIVAADQYQVDTASRVFISFIDDLSNWYVRRSRERFHPSTSSGQGPSTQPSPKASAGEASSGQDDQGDSDAAFTTLHEVLVRTVKLLAPFMPFVSEAIYRNLTGGDSVHLELLPDHDEATNVLSSEEAELLQQMQQARVIVSAGLALRAGAGIKVRQPLAELVVLGEPLSETLLEIVRDEMNVKEVLFVETLPSDADYTSSDSENRVRVAIKTVLTDELRREGVAREVIRQGQVLRREAEYELDDRIVLIYRTEDVELAVVLDEQREMITEALQADDIVADGAEDGGVDVTIGEAVVHLGVMKK